MKDLNLELLNETYNRVVNFLEKNSDLKIFISGDVNDINSNFTEIYISKERSSSLIFKSSLKSTESFNSTEEYNKYSFLLYHKDTDYYNYIGSSIFNFAKKCRNYYNKNKYCVDDYSIAYEIYSSEAGRIIKELGFPCCLEELAIKMDLMGI
jgi:hypothetical protein